MSQRKVTLKEIASAKAKAVTDLGRPLLDRVLIQESPADEKSAGGIIIPESAQERPSRGIVIAVGRGRNLNEPTEVKANDVVLYGKYAGTEIKIKGKDYLIMRESDILMILPKD